MKNVVTVNKPWEMHCKCGVCESTFVAEEEDLQTDMFKKHGTYWFDGSADAAGLARQFFVNCPVCNNLLLVKSYDISYLLKKKLTESS